MNRRYSSSGRLLALTLALALTLTLPAFSELHWDAPPQQSFKVKPTAEDVKAIFKFQNTGSTPVTISEVKTSCGCTTAALDKKEYAPGEAGQIVADFHVAGRTGHQEKAIMVRTSDQPRPTILSLAVDIPDLVKIDPEIVFWKIGDPPDSKAIHISVNDEVPVRITSVESDNPTVHLTVHETKPGKELELELRPADTAHPASAVLLVQTDYPPENPQTHYAYARVK